MMNPVYRPLAATADSPRSTASNGKHNSPKHPHPVQGLHRAKHQTQQAGAPHTRHQLPSAKFTMRIVGSIRPPSAPRPKVEVLMPSKEPAPAFTTYSPFDPLFPTFTSSKADKSPVAAAAVKPHNHAAKAKAHHNHTANDHAHHKNNRHLKQTPTEQAKKNKKYHVASPVSKAKVQPKAAVTSSSRKITGKRMMKEHTHHIPRRLSDKRPWHLAGWVTYSPFDTNFDRVCKIGVFANGAGVPVRRQRKQRKPHAHHPANRVHHPGHHQAHHVVHGSMAPSARTIADFYATPALTAFPRLSPTAMQQPPVTSFFMPAPRLSVTAMPSSSLAGLPGSMRASTPRAPAFSSGFAW